ncbi:hypothetical protein [Thiothrix unzii]|jgi:hypothetical protein|uniref:hypothetical protein n=1 Tax=Thiothrix unzii TaxID=111769 RepID=UPI002A35FAD9|nr:hypothetical protein [Thiothrix unzii]MDX9989724.1 hypothetical protein [Thiothrix unzii]
MTTAIFGKTPKGIQEVETKANGLSMIERWVLISVDGKRTFEDLKALPRVNDLNAVLTLLETGGYIRKVGSSSASVTNAAANTATPTTPNTANAASGSATRFRELPARFDPATFNMAKNFMVNTLNAFKGFYGATSLVRSIDHCQTHEELRALFDAWHESISGTRQWQKQGADLQKKLLDVI